MAAGPGAYLGIQTDGGFIFTRILEIQADMPSENLVVMYDAVREYSRYLLETLKL